MSNSYSTENWEQGPGAPVHVGSGSSAFLETPAELLIRNQVRGRRKRKGNIWHDEQISFHGANEYTVTIHEFMMATIRIL